MSFDVFSPIYNSESDYQFYNGKLTHCILTYHKCATLFDLLKVVVQSQESDLKNSCDFAEVMKTTKISCPKLIKMIVVTFLTLCCLHCLIGGVTFKIY